MISIAIECIEALNVQFENLIPSTAACLSRWKTIRYGYPHERENCSPFQKTDYFEIGTVLEELKILMMRRGVGAALEPHRCVI
jgi:hypothetical protein